MRLLSSSLHSFMRYGALAILVTDVEQVAQTDRTNETRTQRHALTPVRRRVIGLDVFTGSKVSRWFLDARQTKRERERERE